MGVVVNGYGRVPIKAMYTIAELSRAASMGRGTLRRMLTEAGVAFLVSGRVTYVSIAELEKKVPPLWEGIKTAHALGGAL